MIRISNIKIYEDLDDNNLINFITNKYKIVNSKMDNFILTPLSFEIIIDIIFK